MRDTSIRTGFVAASLCHLGFYDCLGLAEGGTCFDAPNIPRIDRTELGQEIRERSEFLNGSTFASTARPRKVVEHCEAQT